MVDLIPYLVSAYFKTQSTLAPSALLARAAEGYGRRGRELMGQKEALEATLKGVRELNLRRQGQGSPLARQAA